MDFLEKVNYTMENDDYDDSGIKKDNAPLERKFDDTMVRPVSPDESGEGLPYAPIDWPNPGDYWVWRVGHRWSKNGIFHDRYLSVPPRLQKRRKVLVFRSKPEVERYLRSEFPNADIRAFFASFTWEIRAKPEFMQQGKYLVCPSLKRSGVKKLGKNRGCKVYKRKPEDGMCSGSKCLASSPPRQLPDDSNVSQDERLDSPPDCNVQEFEGDQSLEEFDNYLKSLDERLLGVPLPMDQSSSKDDVMTDIRKKLSSLLAMGTDCLLSSDHVNKLINLTYKLQNDPCVEAKELPMLKLIQSIPFSSKSFLEAKQLSSKADNFFDELNAKIASVASLRKEYNATKDQIKAIKADEASTLSDIMDIDQQISNLEKKRQTKTKTIRDKNKKLLPLTSIQKSVMKSLPKLVLEVQTANSEKSIWKLKKKKAGEEMVEILSRFAPLEGFSF